jgi:hypothetical protein
MSDFVEYEEALALKELGFDEPCLAKHDLKFILLRVERCESQKNASELDYILAPLYRQAFRWFRNKYKLSGEPQSYQFYFSYNIIYDTLGYNTCKAIENEFKTFEEAEKACLKKLIEIVKQQSNGE